MGRGLRDQSVGRWRRAAGGGARCARGRRRSRRSSGERRSPSTWRMTTPSCRARTMRASRFGREGQPDAGAGGRGLDQRGQPAVQLLGVPAQRGGRLGVPGGVQAVLGVHQHPGAVGAEGGQAPLDGGGDRVGLVLDAGELLLGAGEVAGGLPGEQGGEQLVLGAEAGVEGAAGEAAAAADVLDAGRGEADLGERLQGGVEQPLDGLRPAALRARPRRLDGSRCRTVLDTHGASDTALHRERPRHTPLTAAGRQGARGGVALAPGCMT